MPLRDASAVLQRLFAQIERHEARFPGYRRFGPRSVLAAVHLLVAGCLVESYDEALDLVMEHLGRGLGWDQPPSRSGLTRARQQVGVAPFRELWLSMLQQALEDPIPPSLSWPEARRYLAVDATSLLMPDVDAVRERWDQAGANEHRMPQALMLCALDINQRLPVATGVIGLDVGERLAATRMVSDLDQTDVLLFDRGYPGRAFFAGLHDRSVDWCVRMTVGPGAFPEVNDFWESDADDTEIWLDLGNGGLVKVRLIRRRFPRGRPPPHQHREKMVILTTLLDRDLYPPDIILDLYHARWEVETFFREIKTVFRLEAVHSRDPDGIMQEVFAILTWMTVTAMIERSADRQIAERHGPQRWNDPQRRIINRSHLIRALQRHATGFLHEDAATRQRAQQAVDRDVQRLVRQATKKRPERSFERWRKRPWGRWKNPT